MNSDVTSGESIWTKEQDKEFENCLALYSGEPCDRWEKIAAALTGKSREEIRKHYLLLVEDINAIESGLVPLPSYADSPEDSTNQEGDVVVSEMEPAHTDCETESQLEQVETDSPPDRKTSRAEIERQRGIPWTEEEHRLFLMGLEKYGKGDWRSISRHFVMSRTPTQLASHAQKYYGRLNSVDNGRRRKSIYDITSVDGGDIVAPQGPIIRQTDGPPKRPSKGRQKDGASASGSSNITVKSPSPSAPGLGVCDDPPTFALDGGDISVVPEVPVTGQTNAASAVGDTGISPPSIGCPIQEPFTSLTLPYLVPTVCGFNTPPHGFTPPRYLDDLGFFDGADAPFL